jgi:hypothetical protein
VLPFTRYSQTSKRAGGLSAAPARPQKTNSDAPKSRRMQMLAKGSPTQNSRKLDAVGAGRPRKAESLAAGRYRKIAER